MNVPKYLKKWNTVSCNSAVLGKIIMVTYEEYLSIDTICETQIGMWIEFNGWWCSFVFSIATNNVTSVAITEGWMIIVQTARIVVDCQNGICGQFSWDWSFEVMLNQISSVMKISIYFICYTCMWNGNSCS